MKEIELLNIRNCNDKIHKYYATFIVKNNGFLSVDSKLKVIKFGAYGYKDYL